MEERAFRGIWIPAEIWLSDELSLIEKVLLVEVDSLDNEDGCFATNDYFMRFFNVSESTITRAIANLKKLGYIESEQVGGRTRILRVVKMTTQGRQNDYSGSSKNSVSSIKEKNKNNNIINKAPEPGASSKKHPRKFSKMKLFDDLESGKDIDEQNKSKRKSPKDKFIDECLDIIDKECEDKIYSHEVHDLLIQYFEFVSAVPLEKKDIAKRVKTVSVWRKKLDRLAELIEDEGYSPLDIIRQSLDKKQYVFYPLKIEYKASSKREVNQQNIQMSDPEWARQVIQEAIDNDEEFY